MKVYGLMGRLEPIHRLSLPTLHPRREHGIPLTKAASDHAKRVLKTWRKLKIPFGVVVAHLGFRDEEALIGMVRAYFLLDSLVRQLEECPYNVKTYQTRTNLKRAERAGTKLEAVVTHNLRVRMIKELRRIQAPYNIAMKDFRVCFFDKLLIHPFSAWRRYRSFDLWLQAATNGEAGKVQVFDAVKLRDQWERFSFIFNRLVTSGHGVTRFNRLNLYLIPCAEYLGIPTEKLNLFKHF